MDINNLNILRSKLEELREKIIGSENSNLGILENYDIERLDEFEKEINKVKENEALVNMINDTIESLISETDEMIQNLYYTVSNEQKKLAQDIRKLFKNIEEEKERIKYLKILGVKNLVLLGANGSGKSAFSAYMKNSLSDNIVVIPAQKFLYYDKSETEVPFMNRKKFFKIQKMNYNEKGIFDGQFNDGYNDRFKNLTKIFNALISLTLNEYIEVLNNKEKINSCEEKNNIVENTNYKKFIKLWSVIYPEISWEEDTNKRIIKPYKNGKIYNINDMSDGEKVVILYILSVLNAEEKSYIIIDEPETFLNPSIYKKLWNLLENIRRDCIFIYISHNVDFISTRFNNDLYWLRSFDGEKNWKIEQIYEDNIDLPRDLLTEILGSQVPIIFCEGTKGSLDYTIYSSLLEAKATIVPVGGHNEVIKYTRAYKFIDKKNRAFGIIDRDQHSEDEIEKYKYDKIFVLQFNEIEMLLLANEILDILINELPHNDDIDKDKFIDKFFNVLTEVKTEILNKKIKAKVDFFFETERADEHKCDDTEMIIKNVSSRIRRLDIEKLKKEYSEKLEGIISKKNYEEALKICHFKNIFSRLDPLFHKGIKYKNAAIEKIENDEALRKKLLDKYFSGLLKMMGLSQDSTAQITE